MSNYYDEEYAGYLHELTPLEKLLQPVFNWERALYQKWRNLRCTLEGHKQVFIDSFSFPPESRKIHSYSCVCYKNKRYIYADTGEEVPLEAFQTGIRGVQARLKQESYIFDLLPKEPWKRT